MEQNKTAQKYNTVGSYLLKVYDDRLKLLTANGQMETQFEIPIINVIKTTSSSLLCIRTGRNMDLAVINIKTK